MMRRNKAFMIVVGQGAESIYIYIYVIYTIRSGFSFSESRQTAIARDEVCINDITALMTKKL